MATLDFVTPEEHAALQAEVADLKKLLRAYVQGDDQWLPTDMALAKAGIKARSTLVKYVRASAPGQQEPGRITYRKEGTKCLYSRNSCIDYSQRRHGQPALNY